ncbi:ABC transporter substrate-binding protein [Actinomadura viridis]|uniref:Peptide/nickel transport system substrate-binding protein n=1 Tax=Actinomadura viridis TaxID=58110 RepID=A0A931DEK1_9ACTN|nr:ABC transporter substrate-binding protein [Actinomadura viridis]MBG6086036.1 peptide/nickel transport system substrate-binding protein [Actinomadura viridis]
MRNQLSRRGFLGATAGAVLLAGCGTGAGSGPGGGRLRAAFSGGGATEVLDPHKANLFVEAARSKAMFDKLADLGDDVAPRPRLAERWEPSEDLRTWRVSLRRATFHDGRPVRAQDVLASYARILDPKGGFRARSSLALIDLRASKAVDDRTVEFGLKRPFAEFPNVLAAFGAYIVPEDLRDFSKPVGSGPFRFKSWTPGRSVVLTGYDGYWEGAPNVEELEFLIANEESARINALLGGQVEYAHDVSPAAARQHRSRARFVHSPNSNTQAFAMKVDRPPFDERDLREAMFLLTDRRQLVNTTMPGAGQIGNDLFGKGYLHYAADIPQREPDLDRAKALIRKAGAEGATIELTTSQASAGFVEAATVFADQIRAAGLDAKIVTGNKDTYWTDILKKGTLVSFRSGAMPIETHISQRLLSDSTTNATKWARPEFDVLYDKAVSSTRERDRQDAFGEMQRMLHAEGGLLVWGFADGIVATSENLTGVRGAPFNTLDWARFDKVRLG